MLVIDGFLLDGHTTPGYSRSATDCRYQTVLESFSGSPSSWVVAKCEDVETEVDRRL